jgi:hypothetical protein
LSRVEGQTTVKDLVALTGLPEERVVDIVGRLADAGTLDVEREAPARAEAEQEAPETTEETASDGSSGLEEEPDEAGVTEAIAHEELHSRAYRQIYETVYHPMDKDRRVKAAGEVGGSDLLALCFDADAQVVHAVLANSKAGLEHARLIALHHRTQMGLEAVARRGELLKDALVQRRLLRNPQIPASLLHRIVGGRMLLEVYKVAVDREIPERSRLLTRETLRRKFILASSDEKASLLFKTEGRCLQHLANCSLDAHATQILCGKTSYTNLFVQNFAR